MTIGAVAVAGMLGLGVGAARAGVPFPSASASNDSGSAYAVGIPGVLTVSQAQAGNGDAGWAPVVLFGRALLTAPDINPVCRGAAGADGCVAVLPHQASANELGSWASGSVATAAVNAQPGTGVGVDVLHADAGHTSQCGLGSGSDSSVADVTLTHNGNPTALRVMPARATAGSQGGCS